MATEAECLEALRRAAEELGESPSKAQYEELGYTPASATIQRVFGGWNAAKEAAGLETNSSTGSRTAERPDDVDLPDDVEWEELTVDQRWHYRNVEWNTQRTLERRRDLRSWVAEYKRNRGGCSECPESDPDCIDAHHADPSEKEMDVNEMVVYGYSRDAIEEELETCVLLCANCHRREHDRSPEPLRSNGSAATGMEQADESVEIEAVDGVVPSSDVEPEQLRAWTFEYKRAMGCHRCNETDPVCLHFHHPEGVEKVGGVGAMISDCRPVEAVLAEVRKCTVLCANCHRKTHRGGGD